MRNDEIKAFRIEVASEVLSDLRQRLKNTRWSYQLEGTNWDAGTDLDYLKELVGYWQNTYDWRKQEAALNQFAHLKTRGGLINWREQIGMQAPISITSRSLSAIGRTLTTGGSRKRRSTNSHILKPRSMALASTSFTSVAKAEIRFRSFSRTAIPIRFIVSRK